MQLLNKARFYSSIMPALIRKLRLYELGTVSQGYLAKVCEGSMRVLPARAGAEWG